VAVAEVFGRGEAVVGADGEVFLFFCSGMAGDRPGDGSLDDTCRASP
jgi:hypothetical protein